eukprot:357426-Chlamydomonas_euryale.AAC.1
MQHPPHHAMIAALRLKSLKAFRRDLVWHQARRVRTFEQALLAILARSAAELLTSTTAAPGSPLDRRSRSIGAYAVGYGVC